MEPLQIAFELQHYDTTATTCVGVAGGSEIADQPVTVQACTQKKDDGNLWTLKYMNDDEATGKFQIVNAKSKLCLSRTGASGTPVKQQECSASVSTTQFFTRTYVNNSVWELTEYSSGLCLSAYPNTIGTPFVILTCDHTPKQRYHYNSVTMNPRPVVAYARPRRAIADSHTVPNSLRDRANKAGLYFGTMVDPTGDSFFTDPQMQTIAETDFNMIVPGLQLKWSRMRPSATAYDFVNADLIVDFAGAKGQKVRGHTFAWDIALPAWLTGGGYTGAQLETLLLQHIETTMRHYMTNYPGVVTVWDVVNEPFGWNHYFNGNTTIWSKIGTNPDQADYVRKAFRKAREVDPDAVLCLNDYYNEGSVNKVRSDYLFNFVKQMISEGVPIDCVGMQAHNGYHSGAYQNPVYSEVMTMMARYAAIGLEVQITEFDYVQPNAATSWTAASDQAEVMLKACIDSPNCTAFVNWGFSQKYLLHDWGASYSTMLMYDTLNTATAMFIRMDSLLLSAPAGL